MQILKTPFFPAPSFRKPSWDGLKVNRSKPHSPFHLSICKKPSILYVMNKKETFSTQNDELSLMQAEWIPHPPILLDGVKTGAPIVPSSFPTRHRRNGRMISHVSSLMKKLHFAHALQILESIDETVRSPYDWYQIGVCLSGLQRMEDALDAWHKALADSPSPLFDARILIRLCRAWTQAGRLNAAVEANDHAATILKALQVGSKKHRQLFAYALLTQAWLLYEQGDIAAALHNAIEVCDLPEDESLGHLQSEAWTLRGDILSVLSQSDDALEAYRMALHLWAYIPKNWRPLREALILNNAADVFEGDEEYDQAMRVYDRAVVLLDAIDDFEIVDLAGCRLEILISRANCLAQIDQSEAMEEDLRAAAIETEHVDLPVRLYWQSRIEYIRGLSELYRQDPRLDPFAHLIEAYLLQKDFLSRSPVSSREYLGRIAYYAAYCCRPGEDAHGISAKELYQLALREFKASAFKDPHFFLFSIASIHNELGSIALSEGDREEAVHEFEESAMEYRRYLKQYPDDEPALANLLVSLINEITSLDSEDLDEKGREALDEIFTLLEDLQKYEGFSQEIESALNILLDDDRLYERFASELEEHYITLVRARTPQRGKAEPILKA